MEASEFYPFKSKFENAGVTLVAVSKTKSESEIMKLYDLGQRDFGENYVQELVDKQANLPKDIRWHFIGHLQRNKVKYIAPFVHLVHSVDSPKLLQEVNKQAAKLNKVIDVLLQVHIAEEETKFGFDENELRDFIPHVNQFNNIRVRGLMGMATFTDNQEKVNSEFEKLKRIFDQCNFNAGNHCDILSMGMSADYEVAIKNGSSMVRIGSLLFGART